MNIPSPLRVLIVEDDRTLQALAEDQLWGGTHPTTVTSVATLAAAVAAEHPDVCLLDLGLPDSQGCSSLLGIMGAHPNAGIVVLSEEVDSRVVLRAYAFGAQRYVVKGTSTANLDQILLAAFVAKRGEIERLEQAIEAASNAERAALDDAIAALQRQIKRTHSQTPSR